MRKLAIGGLTLGVLAVMGVLRAVDLRWARTDAIEAAESRAANLAHITSAYLAEAFASGDASLRQLAVHSQRVGGPAASARDWAPSLASAKAGLTSIGAITVLDREGIIRHSTRPEIQGQSRSDSYLFQQAIRAATDDLIIGTPFPTITEPPALVIPTGRRLTTEQGQINGMVAASFVPALPRGFLRTVDVGERGAVWVFHVSGVILFREPSAANPIGESAATNPIYTKAARGDASGSLREPLNAGGPVLLTSFNRTSTPPLIVAISLDEDEVLADWRREALASALLFGAIGVTLSATLGVLFWQMDARVNVEHALAETQRHEAARLRDANEQLAAALEREQVARREAEEANTLKDQFLMTVSHELRTPLTAICGWARMLASGMVGEKERAAALQTIERNARAQTRLIDDLLDVSGAMAGTLRLDMQVIDVRRAVENAVDTVRPTATAKGVDLVTTFAPGIEPLVGDPTRLQQVIWNLLSNAVKFTSRGGRVEVSTAVDGDSLEIAVADDGIGISRDFLPYVFEPFRQEEAGTKRRFGGLGLGLAIVRNLVELHGGSVAAHSDGEGRGARFVVRLPANASAASLTSIIVAGED